MKQRRYCSCGCGGWFYSSNPNKRYKDAEHRSRKYAKRAPMPEPGLGPLDKLRASRAQTEEIAALRDLVREYFVCHVLSETAGRKRVNGELVCVCVMCNRARELLHEPLDC